MDKNSNIRNLNQGIVESPAGSLSSYFLRRLGFFRTGGDENYKREAINQAVHNYVKKVEGNHRSTSPGSNRTPSKRTSSNGEGGSDQADEPSSKKPKSN